MKQLPMRPPAQALALRLLAPVPYAQRFPAGRLRPPVGVTPGDVRSLPELHRFLAPSDESLPGLDLAKLPGWVGRVVGDPELSARLEAAVGDAACYVEACLRVHELVGERLEQARVASRPGVA
ncbi:MAG: hypothetical protein HGA98_05960 [Deltaproteobacteria bacterium]|nr:hypothetical protein [Deltaproteobacteria bacterium]